ncbi:MAG: tyrosine-type recombinase/integrase [Lachnospiraceae bacterium]|nr:tyrosine-type recombinase/integrase [Lachnospiraceae bacterium]
MEQYKSNVAAVMQYLKNEGFSASTISKHKLCYQGLEDFLAATDQPYSFDVASQWIASNQANWNYRKYTGYKHCIQQLDDVYLTGSILADHLCFRKPPYNMLCTDFKSILDSFLNNSSYKDDDRYRIACARFLLYLQDKGLHNISDLDYELVLKFHENDHHVSQKSKDVYEDMIRVFLRHLATIGDCPFGLSLALNKLIIPHIIHLSDAELMDCTAPDDYVLTWDDILHFLLEMEAARYGCTVLKSSKHILTLLYIFLDMHHSDLNDTLVWYWFHKVEPLLGTNMKQHRRTLCQFLVFLDTGTIITAVTGDPEKTTSMDVLPEWEKSPLSEYLALLKREGWQPSTIAMHKSSNLRFCRYLNDMGIQCFNDVTPEVVMAFNLQDKHGTPEGKVAYNCRIRSFIIYLYEKGFMEDPYLYKALPTMASTRTSIIRTLSKEDVASIWSVDPNELSSKELRDYAIVCVGLSMGFRASDIISLRFSNIDWKVRSISIVQRKTGKVLTMPMPVKTGNILFRYIRDGRPKSDSRYIFIRHEAPYDGLKSGVCRSALKRFIASVDSNSCSFHTVRRTFATNLLTGSVNVELISDSLGHATDGTVHKYLSLDENRMRMCPLSLAEADIHYKGGVFHA